MSETSEDQRENPNEDFRENLADGGGWPDWIGASEAADILGVSTSSVRRAARDGVITSMRTATLSGRTEDSMGRQLGGRLWVDRASVHAWGAALRTQRVSPGGGGS